MFAWLVLLAQYTRQKASNALLLACLCHLPQAAVSLYVLTLLNYTLVGKDSTVNGTATFEEYATTIVDLWWPTVKEVKPIHGTKPTKPCNHTSHVR